MGKRKVKKQPQGVSSSSQASTEDSQKTDETKAPPKGKKQYSLQEKKGKGADVSGNLPKVSLSSKQEVALVDLITEHQKSRKMLGDVSKRITTRKLTDLYNTLSAAGFTRNQVESAMSNTITYGGDLIDALDWLCLHTQNDQLPVGFSEVLHQEEEKRRPAFDVSLQIEAPMHAMSLEQQEHAKVPVQTKPASSGAKGVKDWILQYAEQSSDSEGGSEEEEEAEFNPTTRYVELHDSLSDLKDEAALAKSTGATAKHKELSKKLRELHLEMSSLEKHPEFDKSIKSELKQADAAAKANAATSSQKAPASQSAPEMAECQPAARQTAEPGGEEELGLGLFARAETESIAKPSVIKPREKEDVRCFEYTRAQWTGKSPKQFLIDWVRKHLPKSGPPKFRKVQVRGNKFKSTCLVQKSVDETLQVTPTILTENAKDSEHLACVLALYNLCKGQPLHQLLPPPYRDVWLEWRDAEQKQKDDAKEKVNKPRDQFVSRLMKTLQEKCPEEAKTPQNARPVSTQRNRKREAGEKEEKEEEGGDSEEEDSWEQLADQGRLADISGPEEGLPEAMTETTQETSHRMDVLRAMVEERQASREYADLLQSRQQLPVYQHREQILSAIQQHSVVVVAGETGSGKSTQVPQFVFEDCLQRGVPDLNIVCTQPRRISATSLAARVGQEMGEGGCSAARALVGYQIRFESRHGPYTRINYCTTGVLLRRLQSEPLLQGISHLIIDEVHERSVQSDFLLVVVQSILRQRPGLKVILMSATVDSDKFSAYFSHCPVVNIPGKLFPVEVHYLEDVIEMSGYIVDEDSPCTLRANQLIQEQRATVEVTQKGGDSSKQTLTWTQDDISRLDLTELSPDKYSLRTRNAVTRLNLSRINFDLISDLLVHLDSNPPFSSVRGAVLIFLPGLADIQEMYEILTTQRQFNDETRYKVFSLHSALSGSDQSQVFQASPPGVRKVVIATNIAETGITIPDVVFVIDSGKHKEKRYNENSQMSSLEEVFISKANCKQRAGRAGRVQEGFCFRLVTREQYKGLKAYSTPELLRVPLEELCLNIMKCGYGTPQDFLSRALDPPQPTAVSRALAILVDVGACGTDHASLTPLGHHLAALPVDVRIGKMLVMAAIFGCLEHIAVIAAAMTDKSPFVVPLSKRSEADHARQSLALACSDHLTLYKAYMGWVRARHTGRSTESSYLSKHFLKRSTLLDIENVKKDLVRLVHSIGFKPGSSSTQHSRPPHQPSSPEEVLPISTVTTKGSDPDQTEIALVKAVLTAGLYPQAGVITSVASVDVSEKKSCVVDTSQGPAVVHPSSVNKHTTLTGSWMVYQEKVRGSRVYLRDTTVVSPFCLLLFGGAIDVQHTQRTISLDSWISYKAVAKTGVIFKELRVLLNDLLERKLREPAWNIAESRLIGTLKDLIASEHTGR